MNIENSKGFGKTRVEWSIDSSTDETATELNAAIREAVEDVRTGSSERSEEDGA